MPGAGSASVSTDGEAGVPGLPGEWLGAPCLPVRPVNPQGLLLPHLPLCICSLEHPWVSGSLATSFRDTLLSRLPTRWTVAVKLGPCPPHREVTATHWGW